MIGAEQDIPGTENVCEIGIVDAGVVGMVPAMEARRREELRQWAEMDVGIEMHELVVEYCEEGQSGTNIGGQSEPG